MPDQEVWLVGEKRISGEQKCYLANLPADAKLRTLAATITARRGWSYGGNWVTGVRKAA
jgi:hypothetical protein